MFNISKLVNKITDRGGVRDGESNSSGPGAGPGSMSIVEGEDEQHSEGFLCPPCMRAFPSAEELEAHYNAAHVQGPPPPHPHPQELLNDSTSLSSASGEDFRVLRDEIQSLQHSLAEEKSSAEELKQEVLKIKAGQADGGDSVEKDFESVKALLHSELALLRKQLTDSLEQISTLKKEKGELQLKIDSREKENSRLNTAMSVLESQLAHKNSIDDAAVLKQELVSVQRMMDNLAIEKEQEIEALNQKLLQMNLNVDSTSTQNQNQNQLQLQLESLELESLDLKLKLAEALQLNHDLGEQLTCLTSEGEKARGEHTEQTKEISALRQQLSDVKDKLDSTLQAKSSVESERCALSEEIQRLGDQQRELIRRVEGGEGAQAALDSLQKENEVLKETLKSSTEKNSELSKNLHNKSQAEERALKEVEELKLSLARQAKELSQSSGENTRLKNLLTQKEEELKQGASQIKDLSNVVSKKDNEISEAASKLEKSTQEFKQQLEALGNEKVQCETKLQTFQETITSLKKCLLEKEQESKVLQKSEESLKSEIFQNLTRVEELTLQLQDANGSKEKLESALSSAKENMEELKKRSKSQLDTLTTLEGKIKREAEENQKLVERYKALEDSSRKAQEEAREAMEAVIRERVLETTELFELKASSSELKKFLEDRESKIQVLQAQTDSVLSEKIDFERRYKAIEDEKTLLLEKCLSGESDLEEIRRSMTSLQRKLEDSNAALQELGRENQSLQMESAKLQGRKWLDDSLVPQCPTCEKEFTLTIRKHHCRHCGNIFCNDCSSRTAAVPSYKKPARVCDPCYQELLSK